MAVAAQVLVSLALLRYALTDASVGASLRHLAGLPLGFILLSFGIIVAIQLLVVSRWWLVLGVLRSGLPYWALLKITFVGFLFNNFMPALVGQDAVRIYYTGRDSTFLGAGVSVLFDKVLGLLVIASFSCLPLFLGPAAGPEMLHAGRLCLAAALLLALGLLALLAPMKRVLNWLLGGRPWAARLLDGLLALVTGFRACVTPGVFLAAYVVGFLMLAGLTVMYMEYIRLTGAASPGFWELFGSVSVVTLLTSLPISFNGIGVREKAHIVFLAALGVSKDVALGIAIMQYAFVLGLSCIGLVVWVRMRRAGSAAGRGREAAPVRPGN
nr:lysylphosphatidylglycerol synthase transmembrane domain-containing protein [Desulfovibrio aminophilus]